MILTQDMIANMAIWIVYIISSVGFVSQIMLNYKVKSTIGLSNTYITIYFFGYAVQLLYVFCLNLPIAYRVMVPVSFLFVIILVFQCFFYNKHKIVSRQIRLYCVNFGVLFILFVLIVLAIDFPNQIGHLAGWISVVIWTVYQLPQIFKIYSKKSVIGFSFAFVLCGGFQNLLEIMAVLVLEVPLQSIIIALRGLIFFAIFCFQFWIYRKKVKLEDRPGPFDELPSLGPPSI